MQSVDVAALPKAPARALLVGLLAVGAGLVPAVATSLLSPFSAAGAVLGYLLGAALIGGAWRAPRFGVANAVTLARLVGTCWVGALTIEAAVAGLGIGDRLLLIGLAAGCLVLDGIDGRVARARGEVSGFGARFDMETDALLLLWLSLVIPVLGVAGWWTVAVSGLRYGYLVASWFIPALRVPLYYSYPRKVAAAIGGISLVTALTVDLVWPGWPASLSVFLGLACLCWSFGRDIAWQLRRYRRAPDRAAGVR